MRQSNEWPAGVFPTGTLEARDRRAASSAPNNGLRRRVVADITSFPGVTVKLNSSVRCTFGARSFNARSLLRPVGAVGTPLSRVGAMSSETIRHGLRVADTTSGRLQFRALNPRLRQLLLQPPGAEKEEIRSPPRATLQTYLQVRTGRRGSSVSFDGSARAA